jgi:hypothetical protein
MSSAAAEPKLARRKEDNQDQDLIHHVVVLFVPVVYLN